MDGEASSNKRAPKLRRSCETCRGSKGKCLPSDNDPSRCQKCLKDGKSCIFAEAKPRPKRAKNSRIRVAEMEEKLEGLLNLLAAQTGAAGVSTSQPDTPSASGTSSTPSSTRDQIDLPFFPDGTNDEVFPPDFTFPSTPFPARVDMYNNNKFTFTTVTNFDRIQDVITKGIISSTQAEQALRLFQTKATVFPFVLVPEGMSLDALRRHRPFLLLTILTTASAFDVKLQEKLEREIREVLSKRLIVNGESSLDLLEGILVYLAWYHLYFNPENQQLYQLCQMATSLVADLGINKPPRQNSSELKKCSIMRPSHLLSEMSAEDAESKRVYLGSYFISSSICHGLRRPNNMKFSSYMEECAQDLAQSGKAETDRLLHYFIQLQRLCEEVSDTFDYPSNFELPPLDAVRIGVLAKTFEQQLNQIESSFSPEAWNNVQLTMHLQVVRIHINEVGFHASALPQDELLSPQLKARSWYYSSARSESLIRCLQASKDYLDRFLSLSSEDILNGLLPDVLGLVYTVLVLGTFAVRIDTPSLDVLELREMANYEHYLNALVVKTTNIRALIGPAGSNDYLQHVHVLFLQTKVWYAQILADPTAEVPTDVRRPGFSFTDLITTIVHRCVDFGTVASLSGSTTSDEQWTELLSEWSGSLETSNTPMEGISNEFQA